MIIFRHCCKRSTSDSSGEIRSSYFDLDEESSGSRPSRQHSYVNSEVRNMPTCSQPPPMTDPPAKPSQSKCFDQTARFHSSNGNEYASVCMPKQTRSTDRTLEHSYKNHVVGGACASGDSNRGSTSTEGDYDIVWDSMKFHKQFSMDNGKSPEARPSTSSDNIYSEIERVSHVNKSKIATKPVDLFPPSCQFGEHIGNTKAALTRTRSKSM